MSTATGYASRAVRVEIFSEPDALEDSRVGTHASVVPLGRVPFLARRIALQLGDVVLEIGNSSPAAVIGVMPPGRASLLLPLDGIGSLTLGGRRTEPGLVAVLGAGAEYECASRGRVAWAMITLTAAGVETNLFPAHSAIRRFGSFGVVRANPAVWRRAASLIGEVGSVALGQPEVFDAAEARRALRSSLRETAHELLSGPFDTTPGVPTPTGLPLAATWQRRLTHVTAAAVQADPAHLVSAAALAARLGVSERRLRSAFIAVLGIGVTRYLQVRRLVMVRHALRGATVPVEAVSVAYGFRHAGSFRRAYQAMFGELPAGR